MDPEAGEHPPEYLAADIRATAQRLHKIPWDDPGFSERMLREHLSQAHDGASRRTEIIEAQVNWIEERLLPHKSSRVLDLGCGPGLYTERLAALGHRCTGIDFSPASIEYARRSAAERNTGSSYVCEEVRTADYGGPFDLIMMLSGELNTFGRNDTLEVLRKARASLADGGILLLEVHTLDAVRNRGLRGSRRYASKWGPFSGRAHIVHQEHTWDEEEQTAHTSYFVIDAATSEVTPYGETAHGYPDEALEQMLRSTGFARIERDDTFPPGGAGGDGLVAWIAHASRDA